jgi:hypothetical protein
MPTITYKGHQVSATDVAARHIATMDAVPLRTRPLMVEPAGVPQNTAPAQVGRAPRAFFTREGREADRAQLRAQNEANRAFWAARRP